MSAGTGNGVPKVKRIPWALDKEGPDGTYHCRTLLGYYAAWEDRGVGYFVKPGSMGREVAGKTAKDGMDACQADFDAKVLGCLELDD